MTGARVTARPSGTGSRGWKEPPRLERLERRGAGSEDARPGAPAGGAGRGAGLSAGKWGTFFARGPPLPPWRRGRLFTSFFFKKKKSLPLLLLSHAKLFISAAVGAADGGGERRRGQS